MAHGQLSPEERGQKRRREELESGSSSATEGHAEHSKGSTASARKIASQMFADVKAELDRQICSEEAKVSELQKTLEKQNIDAINDRRQIEVLEEEKDILEEERGILEEERDFAESELHRLRDINERLEERLRKGEKIVAAAKAVVRGSWKEFGARMDELAEAVKRDD